MVLKKVIKAINLDEKSFQTHSFRVGRSCDLLQAGYPIDQIKLLGHWKSKAVYKYLR